MAKYGRASVGHEKCSNRGRSSLIFCPGGSSKLFQNVLAAETSIFFMLKDGMKFNTSYTQVTIIKTQTQTHQTWILLDILDSSLSLSALIFFNSTEKQTNIDELKKLHLTNNEVIKLFRSQNYKQSVEIVWHSYKSS